MNNSISIEPKEFGKTLAEFLKNPDYIFVFSTDVVMNSWIDWCVIHSDESGVSAVPLERFVAWDKFKGEYVKAKEEHKSSIPSILRKIFVQNLIEQNKKELFFKKIINPLYADSADSFTDWISKLLPSLFLFHQMWQNSSLEQDDEVSDYELLFSKYSDFLNANNLFEPAWIIPDFSDSNKKVLLVYPEILEDFADYSAVFEKCPSITLVTLPKTSISDKSVSPLCYKYSDSRKELRRTILKIKELIDSEKASYEDITLNVPDLQTYRPYLERELENYCIPYVIRAGFPLTKNCAGVIFEEILNCFSSDFTYNSVKALLLDNYIPWKQEFDVLRENLIAEGQAMRCLCNYSENGSKVDIWQQALSSQKEDNRELQFYLNLKKDISAICKASCFQSIHTAWMSFKASYLAEEGFSESADKIISRCITELNALISIEQNWFEKAGLCVTNPYEFFVNEIKNKTYTPQNKAAGISVYPYKLSAAAAYKYQFVIDASQNNLEIPYKRLSFLNSFKRKLLNLTDDDKLYNASEAFIRLYAKNTPCDEVCFSYAENSFSGFAIAHTFLKIDKSAKEPLKALDNFDFIENEKNWLLNNQNDSNLVFSLAQKNQFLRWYNTNIAKTFEPYKVCPSLRKKITSALIDERSKHIENISPSQKNKLVISQSDMKNFFPCPRYWIFSNILKLKPESLDTSLIQTFDMGNINHKILELFAKELMEQNMVLPSVNSMGLFEDSTLAFLKETITKLASKTIHDPYSEYGKSPLTVKMLESQNESIVANIISFLQEFCKSFAGYRIKGVETWYSSSNPKRNFNLTGKIDCLLCSGDGNSTDFGWTIIDYKNTKGAIPAIKNTKVDDEGNLNDFQIPMYVTLIQENETVKDISLASFYAIKTGEKAVIIDNNDDKKNFKNFKPTLEAFEEYAQNFASIVEKGDFTPVNVDTYEDCSVCNFKSICRYNYTVAGRTK